MNAQFRKPWFIVAVVFMLVMTVWIRLQEYHMPLKAAQLQQEVTNTYEPLKGPDADSFQPNKALELYEQARNIMVSEWPTSKPYPRTDNLIPWHSIGKGRYRDEDIALTTKGELLLPPPSQPIPENTLAFMRDIVEKYREVLDLLLQAGTLPLPQTVESFIANTGVHSITEDHYYRHRYDFYANENIKRLLFVASILAITENNEEEALGALETLCAFTDAAKMFALSCAYYPPSYDYFKDIWDITVYGLERHVFSDAMLDRIDALFEKIMLISNRDVLATINMLENSSYKRAAYEKRNEKRRLREQRERMIPFLGDGLLWYQKRFHILKNIGNLTMNRYVQHDMLGKDCRGDDIRYLYLSRLFVDDVYGRMEIISFEYLYYATRWQYYTAEENKFMPVIRLAIAAEKYRRHKGAFPASILDLVPEYMSAESLDRILSNRYIYERTEKGWAILRSKRIVRTYPMERNENW